MDCLPIELWSRIFSLACVDGGRTGCSLSEVSQYFRAAVLPVQVQSVALLGTYKMSLFYRRVLEARPPKHRRVLHLFLSKATSNRSPHAQHEEVRTGSGDHRADRDILQGILACVGPELRTLTTLLTQHSHSIDRTSVLCNAFPHLEELTTGGCLFPPANSAALQICFPMLTRLHMLSVPDAVTLYTSRAPRLTHMRLSTVWSMSDELYDGLAQFLRDDEVGPHGDRARDPKTTLFPTSLATIIIALDTGMIRGLPQARYNHGPITSLHALDRWGRLVVLNSKKPYQVSVPDARRDWEDRIGGGEGCWDVPKQRAILLKAMAPIGARSLEI
jgi:hypothetical protein